MGNSKWIPAALLFLLAIGCKQKATNGAPPGVASLEVKRNTVCNGNTICARAAFRLNRQVAKEDTKMIERMDKELIDCFTMASKGDTSMPVAVERVNYGVGDEIVYVMYFANNENDLSDKKIIYNDRFFGWKNQAFIIERN